MRELPVYIVSGDGPRCGSSMMMQALEAGGMEVAYSKSEEVAKEEESAEFDWDISPGGRYEMAEDQLDPLTFPFRGFEGRAVKALAWPWTPFFYPVFLGHPPLDVELPPDLAADYRVVWLHRAFKPRWLSFARSNRTVKFLHTPAVEASAKWRDACSGLVLATLRIDQARLIEFDYEEILKEPIAAFEKMAEAGWPIDAAKAADVIDPALKRF